MAQFLKPNIEEIAAKLVDGEAVLINLANGMYYSMDQVGGFVWSLIEDEQSLEAITAAVAQRYTVDESRVSEDLAALTERLVDEDLVVLVEGQANGALPTAEPAPPGETYAAPQLNKFDDMAELFALDPPLPKLSSPHDRDADSG